MKKSILICLFCILAGCATVEGLYQDPSFTYGSVRAGNIGVGGVASTSKALSPGEQSAYSNLIRNSLFQHFPGMNIMPQGDAVSALGAPRYQSMMRFYADNGVIQDQYLTAFKNHITHMRYLVFARIISYQTSRRHDEVKDFDHSSYRHDHDRDFDRPTSESLNYYSTLEMRVEMSVYDLNLQRVVWSGNLDDSRENRNTYTLPEIYHRHHESFDRSLLTNLANMMLQNEMRGTYQYPPTPSSSALLQDLFRGLIGKFPVIPE
jgi:hypothetical protein